MVAPFANDTAFAQLRDKGVVVTFRGQRWSQTGADWVNRGRGTEKEFDVYVYELGEFAPTPDDLAGYVLLSGFDSTIEWVQTIQKLHGNVETGWLYAVVREDLDALGLPATLPTAEVAPKE